MCVLSPTYVDFSRIAAVWTPFATKKLHEKMLEHVTFGPYFYVILSM